MNFKINKDKENSKTQRACWIMSPSNNNSEKKGKNISNCTNLNITAQGNHKFVKLRRNSNFNPKSQERCELESLKTICAKRISLCDNRQKSKSKNCRSASSHYQKSILLQSNFDVLKQQARKLEQEQGCYGVYHWRQINRPTQGILNHTTTNFRSTGTNQNESSMLESIKRNKKSNMRKIVKGRPQIKKLLEQNRERALKQHTIQYSQQYTITISQDKQKQKQKDKQNNKKKDIQNLDSIDVNIQVIKKKCNMKNGNNYRISGFNNCQYHNIHNRIKNYINNNSCQPIMHTIL